VAYADLSISNADLAGQHQSTVKVSGQERSRSTVKVSGQERSKSTVKVNSQSQSQRSTVNGQRSTLGALDAFFCIFSSVPYARTCVLYVCICLYKKHMLLYIGTYNNVPNVPNVPNFIVILRVILKN